MDAVSSSHHQDTEAPSANASLRFAFPTSYDPLSRLRECCGYMHVKYAYADHLNRLFTPDHFRREAPRKTQQVAATSALLHCGILLSRRDPALKRPVEALIANIETFVSNASKECEVIPELSEFRHAVEVITADVGKDAYSAEALKYFRFAPGIMQKPDTEQDFIDVLGPMSFGCPNLCGGIYIQMLNVSTTYLALESKKNPLPANFPWQTY